MPTREKCSLLATLADRNFLDQAKQLFSSVYWNAGWTGEYALLAHDIPENELTWFRDKGIHIYHCAPLEQTLGTVGIAGHPATVLSKFYLFKPYFKQWQKVVYLDADIIVSASLHRLLETPHFSAPNATGLRLREEFVKADTDAFRTLERQINFRGRAFNTGVMAFDTDVITDNTFAALLSLYKTYGSLNAFGDEGILNIYFYQKWSMLPIIYNTYPEYLEREYWLPPAKQLAIIRHFVSIKKRGEGGKPWEKENHFYSLWTDNLRRAEQIDLKKHRRPLGAWTAQEEDAYVRYLKRRLRILLPVKYYHFLLGQTGKVINSLSPRLYQFLKARLPV